jgi:ABC-type protease/lipase transport system fused ATPase/permease subunit
MELTIDQAREVARLRRRFPAAEVVVHHRPHDLIVELRRGRRTVALERFAADGSVSGQQRQSLALAA